MTIAKGKSFTIYDSGIAANRKIHIVELIENDMIVYKYYGKHKQWWHYVVKSRKQIEFMIELGIEEKLMTKKNDIK